MREELIKLVSVSTSKSGSEICKVVIQIFRDLSIDISKVVSVTTDGTPNMVGEKVGFVKLFTEAIGHPIEVLCAKAGFTDLNDLMSVVTKIVNLIAAFPLHKREFLALLLEVDSTYSGLLMYNNVRWLSRGKVLERFVECFEKIKVYLDDKDLGNFPQLNDDKTHLLHVRQRRCWDRPPLHRSELRDPQASLSGAATGLCLYIMRGTAMAQTLSLRCHWQRELSVLPDQSATPATPSPAPCASLWPNRGRSGVMLGLLISPASLIRPRDRPGDADWHRNRPIRTKSGMKPRVRCLLATPLLPPPPCSYALMALAPLTPTDSAEQLEPTPAAAVSGVCYPDHPSKAGGGGEALTGNQGWKLPLAPADGAK
ncbi:hypothetical protein QTO34_014404 [Cnephaeus nilssonii]|uniref:Uncharacterized protein n=1 Tax=Cnephaeus nilssonii TaxID=3371016 RepID=A0AA40I7A8_CNENI|nr:hypothetical protein QTO34_014404 [Eptesicus nilssonii]